MEQLLALSPYKSKNILERTPTHGWLSLSRTPIQRRTVYYEPDTTTNCLLRTRYIDELLLLTQYSDELFITNRMQRWTVYYELDTTTNYLLQTWYNAELFTNPIQRFTVYYEPDTTTNCILRTRYNDVLHSKLKYNDVLFITNFSAIVNCFLWTFIQLFTVLRHYCGVPGITK